MQTKEDIPFVVMIWWIMGLIWMGGSFYDFGIGSYFKFLIGILTMINGTLLLIASKKK